MRAIVIAIRLAIFAVADLLLPSSLIALACEHYRIPGGFNASINGKAKQYITRHRASGHTYVQVWAMARSVDDLGLKRAILFRLSTRISKNNPLHHALVTEARCSE